ncbi:MAG: DNA repair protein RecO [Candidatus Saccharibacteria bacterium]
MKQILTQAIVLSRTDFGEADRILTLLTADYGKLRVMARGVRKSKSKLAGGIELFSVSDITFIYGRGEIGTLISARLSRYYGNIVKSIERVQLGYDLIKVLHKATEDAPEPEYFLLLEQAFIALDQSEVSVELIRFWFSAQLLSLAGYTPNLSTTSQGVKLQADKHYTFNFDDMSFENQPDSQLDSDHIKFLRLTFAGYQPAALNQVKGNQNILSSVIPLVQTMLATQLQR